MLFVTAKIQKDPQCILANHGMNKGFAGRSLTATVLISKEGKFSYWRRTVTEHCFRDA